MHTKPPAQERASKNRHFLQKHRPLVFIYSPQGGQWDGMGQALYTGDMIFRQVVMECDREIQSALGWSVVDLLLHDYPLNAWSDPYHIQPIITTLQISLTALLHARGILPAAVTGLSMGEVAAAYAAGILGLEDAMKIVCCQAQVTKRQLRAGGMLLVHLGPSQVEDILRVDQYHYIAVGCELSPSMTVLSGEAMALSQLALALEAHQIFVRKLDLGFAFHSAELMPVEHEFAGCLADLRSASEHVHFYSSVTGLPEPGAQLGGAYWWRIMNQRARFIDVIRRILDDGYDMFVEVGPHPTLTESVREIALSLNRSVTIYATMRRGKNDLVELPT